MILYDSSDSNQTPITLYSQSIIVDTVHTAPPLNHNDILSAGAYLTQVRKIDTTSYIILPSLSPTPSNNPTTIIHRLKTNFPNHIIQTQPWSQYIGAKITPISKSINITIHHIPCFMRTKHTIQQVLNPYGLTDIQDNDENNNNDTYFQHHQSKLWFSDRLSLPTKASINLLSDVVCDTRQITSATVS